jgi:hypothetical protein
MKIMAFSRKRRTAPNFLEPPQSAGSRQAAALGAFICALIAGCASPAGGQRTGSAPSILDTPLAATAYNAGETGRAILVSQGASTNVVVQVSGVTYVTRPVHLYSYIYPGSCRQHDMRPAYALTRQVLADRGPLLWNGPYSVRNQAPVSLEQLRSSPHAIVVMSSPADGNFELFCGDLRAASIGG